MLAVMLMFVAAMLATALYTYSTNGFQLFQVNRDRKQAQYLARTGVEITIKAWQSVTSNTLVARETMPVHMLSDGTFVTPGAGDPIPVGSIGYYTVSVDPNGTKDYQGKAVRVINFVSTAVVGQTTATATAYTVMSLNAYEQGWYSASGTPLETGMQDMGSSVVHSSLWWGQSTSNIKLHMFPGNITFPKPTPTSSATFTLNANQKVAYAGKALYFDMPLSLKNGTTAKNVLVLSGGDVVLNGDVELYAYYGLINSGVGTVVLSVLEDYEHDDPTTTEVNRCGKVYFNGDVYITVARLFGSSRTKLFSKGEVYYFKGRDGLDLVKYYIDNNGTGSFIANIMASIYPSSSAKYDRSYMRRIDPAKVVKDMPGDLIPPHPDEEGTVVWQ